MSQASDRKKWDARWAERGEPGEPDPFVVRALGELAPARGRAVELASGRGRHALELARRGYEAHAWDVSPVALEKLGRIAQEADLAIGTRCIDLTGGVQHDGDPFDLVVVVNFLDRGLLATVPGLLRPGGHLVFTTFTVDWPGEHPRRAEFRLARGELETGLAHLETLLAVEEGGRAGLLARR